MKCVQVLVGALVFTGALAAQDKAADASTPATPGGSPATASAIPAGPGAVPAAPGADAAKADPASSDPGYVIGAQDVVSISVWKEPALSGAIPVRPDGKVSLPLLHDVQAAGFTPMQLEADISSRLKKFVVDPQVSVVVTQVNSSKVYVLGEVSRPGPMLMLSGLTALQAIASAGGPTQFANQKKIYILRKENGQQQKIAFNYKKAIQGVESQNITLKTGDTVVVP
jgi:polysaccharide biosynthesis/export protein